MWPFLRLVGILNQTLDILNINFEYKTHLNFGGNFSNKKVRLIVRKIRYPY
jgi:hypothetical protein